MNTMRPKTPILGRLLMRWFLNHNHPDEIIGDYEECFHTIAREKSAFKARLWYWAQVLLAVFSFMRISFNWGITMFSNYTRVTFRNIKRHKGYSSLNVAGLALGMACCILMLLWVQDELSYDRYHEHAHRLFRVGRESTYRALRKSSRVPSPLAPALKNEFPEVIQTTRYFTSSKFIKYQGKNFTGNTIAYSEPAFFAMFSFPFIKGDPHTAIDSVSAIVITEKLADKIFGKTDPVGQILNLDNQKDFIVTGIMQNPPHNSYFQFDGLVPFAARSERLKKRAGDDNWKLNIFEAFVLLDPQVSTADLNPKVDALVKDHVPNSSSTFYLQPVTDIHLHPLQGEGNTKYLYIFSILAAFVLIIACINFMNLATARSGNRCKEIGMRKVLGARRTDLIRQFLGESLLLSLLSVCLAVILVSLLLPLFNSLSGKHIGMDLIKEARFILAVAVVTLFSGLLAGSYPTLLLSSFQPAKVLRDTFRLGTKGAVFRRILVVFQFSVSIFLIIGALVVHSQLLYMQNEDLGFDKDYLIYFPSSGGFAADFAAEKIELLQHPDILGVTRGNPPIWFDVWSSQVSWEGKDPEEEITFKITPVGFDYFSTMKMELEAGRDFSKNMASDLDGGLVINAAAARVMGWDSPVGQPVVLGEKTGRVVGVVKDFHDGSLHNAIYPAIFELDPSRSYLACVRINSVNVAETIRFLEARWNKNMPGFPFEYSFLDETIAQFYQTEQRMGKLFTIFTVLAIIIACLGLFGLASFTTAQQTRQIGIRKVLGASATAIVVLLSRQFTRWVLLSNLFAGPVAFLVMNRWLQNFAYRITIGFEIFLLAGFLTLGLALLTVGFQTVKAAWANPVLSLRYE